MDRLFKFFGRKMGFNEKTSEIETCFKITDKYATLDNETKKIHRNRNFFVLILYENNHLHNLQKKITKYYLFTQNTRVNE